MRGSGTWRRDTLRTPLEDELGWVVVVVVLLAGGGATTCIYFLCFLFAAVACAAKLSGRETQSASGEGRARDASVCLRERGRTGNMLGNLIRLSAPQ